MKKKTAKLSKLERNRYSILTNDLEKCFICKKPADDLHEIFCGSKRQASMKHGFCVPLCRYCHIIVTNSYKFDAELRSLCQLKFETAHSREEFIAIIGRNYL